MPRSHEARRFAAALYRRFNPDSTLGLRWKRQGDHVTFEWDGFVAAPSIPMLFARHYYETSLIERLLREKTVRRSLEFGCGFGRLSPTLARLSMQHVAVDINASAVSAAQLAYPDLTFRTYDGHRLPFADASFDLVVAWTVVQHVPPSHVEGTIADIRRVLQPGGRVLLCEETRLAGQPSRHAWHREADFYVAHFAPLRLTYSSYIDDIDRIRGLTSPGRVMLFEP